MTLPSDGDAPVVRASTRCLGCTKTFSYLDRITVGKIEQTAFGPVHAIECAARVRAISDHLQRQIETCLAERNG